MSYRGAASLLALAWIAAPARAADKAAVAWKFDNPFCRVVARMGPSSKGSGYGLALDADGGSTVDAHVTLVGATDAYDVHVNAALNGSPDDRESMPFLVDVPDSAKIEYYFVDSYAVDGAASTTCPSYVSGVGDAVVAVPGGAPTIAQHLQALGSLKCGSVYTGPALRGQLESAVGAYGGKPLTVVGRAYIDSNGRSVREQIVRTSGIEGFDQFMLGALHEHEFTPAKFLCTPVVSTIDVELKFFP